MMDAPLIDQRPFRLRFPGKVELVEQEDIQHALRGRLPSTSSNHVGKSPEIEPAVHCSGAAARRRHHHHLLPRAGDI